MAATEEERAESQECFRHANDRLLGQVRAVVREGARVPFLCECTDDLCFQALMITVAAYDGIRDGACLFVIAPGHPKLESEGIVSEENGYTIVRRRAA